MKLRDRMWWWMNRKAPGKHAEYVFTAWSWWCSGVLFIIALLSSQYSLIAFAVLLALSIFFGLYTYLTDRRSGVVDAMHQQRLKKRTERMARIGVEDKKGAAKQ